MKLLFLLSLFFLTFFTFGQDSLDIRWSELNSYSIGKDEKWAVDVIGNIYMTNRKVIEKYDSTGQKKFTQSIKSFGKIEKIDPINTMKILIYSEDQQQFCVLDNTLTLTEKCIDFNDVNIGNAIKVAVSGQPDKLWVVDQVNSTLSLLSLSGTMQSQEIKNLSGLLNINSLKALFENDNNLFLADTSGTIYQFDLYGSLVNSYRVDPFLSFTILNDSFLLLYKDKIVVLNKNGEFLEEINLPVSGVKSFAVSNNVFHFQSDNKLSTYRLNLNP